MEEKPRRRWYQFSLRTLFVVVTCVAVWAALAGLSYRHSLEDVHHAESWPMIAFGSLLLAGLLIAYVWALHLPFRNWWRDRRSGDER